MESGFSWILLILLGIAGFFYLTQILLDRIQPQFAAPEAPGMALQREGFQDGGSSSTSKQEIFLENDKLYDDFYAKVYDLLMQNITKTQAKVAMLLTKWKKEGIQPHDMIVADIGCGTGIAAQSFAKMDVKQVIGIDQSAAMLKQAQTYLEKDSKLTANQKQKIVWKQANVESPSALAGAEVTHAVVFYFTLYYLPDKETFFRNLFLWVAPGGQIAVEVVNKHKFDPMLESAAPWIGFSLQKYTKERQTESKVSFDKFDYTGKFELTDPLAEFRETFRFKDGTIRRQRHRFSMPDIEEIVKSAQTAGWKYTQYIDLVSIGYEYAYLLIFNHP